MSSLKFPPVLVVDPACHTLELSCFNKFVQYFKLPCQYAAPILLPEAWPIIKRYEYSAIIVLGSASSVNDPNKSDSFKELEEFCYHNIERDIPFLGICYGHQLLAFIYSGTVDFYNPKTHEKLTGSRNIMFKPHPLWGDGYTCKLVVSHREVVTKTGPYFYEGAYSDLVPHELILHKNKPAWGIQAHPEADQLFLRHQNISIIDFDEIENNGLKFLKSFIHAYLP